MLREYFILPSLSTLQRLTRTAKNIEDEKLFKNIFEQKDNRSKGTILLFDEIYVKGNLSYSGTVDFRIFTLNLYMYFVF